MNIKPIFAFSILAFVFLQGFSLSSFYEKKTSSGSSFLAKIIPEANEDLSSLKYQVVAYKKSKYNKEYYPTYYSIHAEYVDGFLFISSIIKIPNIYSVLVKSNNSDIMHEAFIAQADNYGFDVIDYDPKSVAKNKLDLKSLFEDYSKDIKAIKIIEIVKKEKIQSPLLITKPKVVPAKSSVVITKPKVVPAKSSVVITKPKVVPAKSFVVITKPKVVPANPHLLIKKTPIHKYILLVLCLAVILLLAYRKW